MNKLKKLAKRSPNIEMHSRNSNKNKFKKKNEKKLIFYLFILKNEWLNTNKRVRKIEKEKYLS